MPDRAPSKYAAEGTAAHALAAICLAEAVHPTGFIGEEVEGGPGFLVTQEMCDAVVIYTNVVSHELAQTNGGELYVEKGFQISLAAADPGEVFGTNDALVYHPQTGRLRIFDYKHGAGVAVSATDNDQLKFYAAGAVFSHPEWKINEVILTIVQPRTLGEDPVKDWPFPVIDLLDFVADLDAGVAKAKAVKMVEVNGKPCVGDVAGNLNPGSYCRWCDAAAICPAREREILTRAKLDFAEITAITADDLPEPKTLDAERLGNILAAGELLSGWMAQVREQVEGLARAGKPVPGWKMVAQQARAKWVANETDVAAYVEMLFGIPDGQFLPRKLITITEAEKTLRAAGAVKSDIDTFKLKFTLKESGGYSLVPSSDRRPAVDALATDFASVQPVNA